MRFNCFSLIILLKLLDIFLTSGDFMRSLWFKLSVYFTALIIGGIIGATLVVNMIGCRIEFYQAVKSGPISAVLNKNCLLLAEAMRRPFSDKAFIAAKENLLRDLNMIRSDSFGSPVSEYSRLEVFMEIYDNNGKEYFSDQPQWSEYAFGIFQQRPFGAENDSLNEAVDLPGKGRVWLSMPINNIEDQQAGTIRLLYVADFDSLKLLGKMVEFFVDYWYLNVAVYFSIALMCGLFADRLVTGRLRKMNSATSDWRKGNFTTRIPVDCRAKDILAEHSLALNTMANDLEGLFELRQKMAVAEERSRVARELHDTVKQNLFALSLQLTSIKNKNDTSEIAANIDEAQKITREAQLDITEILTQLNSLHGDEKNLFERIADLGENMRRRFKAIVSWDRQENLSLMPNHLHTLIRVVQEAMTNAVKHGQATGISLSAFVDGGFNMLVIGDNGLGLPFDMDEKKTGSGLTFMRERVGELPGGEFFISRRPGGGTAVTIKWRNI